MIVDDDLRDVSAIEYVARTSDTLVTIKRGGMSALKHLDDLNYEIDALITDLKMEYFDGLNLTVMVRAHESTRAGHKPIAIFWYTGMDFDQGDEFDPYTMAMKKYDVKKVFPKPSDPIDLIAEVKRILEVSEQ